MNNVSIKAFQLAFLLFLTTAVIAVVKKGGMAEGESMLHDTHISISEKIRKEVISMLNLSLASTADLYNQFKQAHWTVRGPSFISLHKFFDETAQSILEHVDTIAERIMSLGGTALGTTQSIGKHTQLSAYPTDISSATDHIKHLAHNVAMLGESSRNNIKRAEELGDIATSDIYIDLTRFLDKYLWFLEAHVTK